MSFIAELGDSEKSENSNQKNRIIGIIGESEEMYVTIHIFRENRKNRVVLGESEKSENYIQKNRIIGKNRRIV